jgi:Domain of unknown function (DUF4160)
MYAEAMAPHNTPHFHAYYQSGVAVYSLTPVELIAGDLPRRQRRLVEAWAELHAEELALAWQTLQAGQLPQTIDPLH